MQLTVLLIALVCVRWFGVPKWVQQDGWIKPWLESLAGPSLNNKPWLYWGLCLFVPLAVVHFALDWSYHKSGFLAFIITALVLLYSVGRQDFKSQVSAFVSAVAAGDYQRVLAAARDLQSDPLGDGLEQEAELYQQTLLNAAYRAMERLFVVFFWFATLGPLAALGYRLLRLFHDQHQKALAAAGEGQESVVSLAPVSKLLWLFEWPVVRLLGLSFAITGNFMACMQRWKHSLLCFKTPSKQVLGHAVGGALDISKDHVFDGESIRCEMEALLALFYRTGLFWLCSLALYLVLAL